MKYLLYLIAFVVGVPTFAQDTLFVRSLPVDSLVNNIDTDGEFLYLRLKSNVYTWENSKLKFIEKGKLKFSWVKFDTERNVKVITHNSIIGANKRASAENVGNLTPGEYNFYTTTALLGDYLYVCHNGIVLEYKINPHFTRFHRGNSIRHIYSEPGFRVISTYDGIFIDSIWNEFGFIEMDRELTKYSNGEFIKIDSTYYLCQDNLITYNKTTKDLKTLINTEEAPRFRKLVKYNNKDFALYNTAFGEVNLRTGERFNHIIEDELSDVIEFKGKLYVSTLNSVLYELMEERVISKHKLSAPINDLIIISGELAIGTSKGLYALKDTSIMEVIPNAEIVQAIPFKDKIVFINNTGLYSYFDGRILPLIENVEFNKMALYQDEHYVYAGSVNGLYVIEKSELDGMLKVQPSVITIRNYSIYYYLLISLLFLFAALTILIIRRRKKGNEPAYPIQKKILLDSEMIRNVVLNNPQILSVEHLAEHFKTSVVQLNRHLKKEELSGLNLLKSIKKEIALEMLKDGKSLEEISKRVGYSMRYVKAKLLKD